MKININIINCAKLSKLECNGFFFSKNTEYNKIKTKFIPK